MPLSVNEAAGDSGARVAAAAAAAAAAIGAMPGPLRARAWQKLFGDDARPYAGTAEEAGWLRGVLHAVFSNADAGEGAVIADFVADADISAALAETWCPDFDVDDRGKTLLVLLVQSLSIFVDDTADYSAGAGPEGGSLRGRRGPRQRPGRANPETGAGGLSRRRRGNPKIGRWRRGATPDG